MNLSTFKNERMLKFKKNRNFQKILKVKVIKTIFDDTIRAKRYIRIV